MEPKKLKRFLIGAGVLFVLLIVGISVGFMIRNSIYSASIYVIAAPYDAQILMNNKIVKSGEKNMAEPGEYNIVISRTGFETEIKTVVLENGSSEKVIVALRPNEPSTMDWYETHPEDAAIADGVVGQKFIDEAAEMAEKYTIVENLPVYEYNYNVGYGDCRNNGGPEFCVVIKAGFGFRDVAIGYLQNTGKDLADYYVEVLDYKTPFNATNLNVPEGLEFGDDADDETDTKVIENEFTSILAVANSRISNLNDSSYVAKVSQLIGFGGGKYCGVKIAVYQRAGFDEGDQEGLMHDTYRMIMAKVDGRWRIVSEPEFLLNYERNPKLPKELIKSMNEF